MTQTRAELRRRFKEEGRPMGVYAFRNTANGKVLVGASANLPGSRNSLRFQLTMGATATGSCRRSGTRGEADFTWEALHELTLEPGRDTREELDALERLWLDELRSWGARGYNRPPAE